MYGHKCQYCNGESNDNTLEIEHILAKSRGGSDSIKNLTIACKTCNQEKNNLTLEEWLVVISKKKDKLSKKRVDRITKFLEKKPQNLGFKDAAKVNSSRKAVLKELFALGKEVIVSTGGVTKYNRITSNLPKEHYYDALCVKEIQDFKYHKGLKCLEIKAQGRGTRSRTLLDKYGFPRAYLPRQNDFFGFMSGDMVKAIVTKGKKAGIYIGTVGCRSIGYFNIKTKDKVVQGINYKDCTIIQKSDGYNYMYTVIK